MQDWNNFAIEFVEKRLRDKDYHFGDQLICNAMDGWVEFIHLEKLGKGLSYQDTYAIKDSIGSLQPPNCMIDTLVIYPQETKYEHILRGLTREWVFRYWQHFDRVKDEQVERFPPRSIPPNDHTTQVAKPVLEEILTILKPLSLDDGLDFMAKLTVAWARRFNTVTFFESVKALGYTIPTTDKDNFATATALWFIAVFFQMEHV